MSIKIEHDINEQENECLKGNDHTEFGETCLEESKRFWF